ncbi:MAG: hypothetical protein IT304_10310 [Dehalococcoidia bacterium]|nr:hypothetical protein [Dehalococcoidia bacterium]
MARTLTQLDEWPRHQTIDTFDTVATSSPQWSDGFWFCFGDPEGRVNLITALRLYPNTNVMDGYVICALDDGRQYNLRVSRRLRPRIDDLRCGPMWMEIMEGLKTIRVGCDQNPHGIAFDVLWEGAAPCFDEAQGHRRYVDGRLVSERSNFVQLGDLSGTITVAGRTFKVDPSWVGARDHSWGIGDTGAGERPNQYAAPAEGTQAGAALRAFGHRQWTLLRFPERSIYYFFHHSNEGAFTAFQTRVDYPYDAGREGWSYTGVAVKSAEFVDGLRRLKSSAIELTRPDGGTDRLGMETVSKPVYMQGGGYWGGYHDGLGRGVYRGEEVVEGDVWDVSHPTIVRDLQGAEIPQRNGAWAETYARFWNLDNPAETGLGLLEAVIAGPYPGIRD